MAYESKIIVVDKYDTKGFDEKVADFYGCQEIASIKLSCIDDEILGMIQEYPETDCYIWDDGEPTHTDKYGKGMTEIPLEEAVKIFIHAKNCFDYRRYSPCAGLLMGFDPKRWDNLVVLHYGY